MTEKNPARSGTHITQLECIVCSRRSATLAVNVVTGLCDACAPVIKPSPVPRQKACGQCGGSRMSAHQPWCPAKAVS